MTTVSHMTMAGILTYEITGDPYVSLVAGLVGGLNDYARIILREGWDKSYFMLHHPVKYFRTRLALIPFIIIYPIGLHALVDFPLHKKKGGWKSITYSVELVFWILILWWVYVKFGLFA